MKVGLIAEFNPLHTGHKYIIKEARNILDKYNGDLICVMSEFFTQRGEAACIDGYARAKEAVLSGCDIVLALPYRASVVYGDEFAKKSIAILNKCGITHLIFGTEQEISLYEEIYKKESELDSNSIKEYIKKGYSYPKIMSKIFNLEKQPNFILGYSYYKNIKKFASHIKLIPIFRKGQNINEKYLENVDFLSATSIRNNINDIKIKNYVSENIYKLLKENSINEEDFFNLLKYKILIMNKLELSKIYDVSEGLENRIFEAAKIAKSYKELLNLISTKRYSNKKIQRILLHILTNTTKEDIEKDITDVRVLAVNKDKTFLIREINKLGLIKLHQKLNSKNEKYFVDDIKISRVYNLISSGEDIFKKQIQLIERI